jgi:hypothetical protein
MQYHLENDLVNATGNLPAVRVVDAHSLLHQRAIKAAKACDAADAVDGLVKLQNPTLRIAALAWGVSVGSVARARRLTPEQRDAVRRGNRPLVLPRDPADPPQPVIAPAPAKLPVPPPEYAVANAWFRLNDVVAEVGLDTVFELLNAMEKDAAA